MQSSSRKEAVKSPKSSASFTLPPGFRKASFCSSWLTGEWWGRRPEELQFYFKNFDGFPLLAFSKANRRPSGLTVQGKKPGQLQQSVKPFFYDISEPTHLEAFLRTLRHMIAFSAGITFSQGRYPYNLEAGDVIRLCKTEVSPLGFFDPKNPDRYIEKVFEILEVGCEYVYDKTVSVDDFTTYWGDDPTKKRAAAASKKVYCNKKVFYFKIKRVLQDECGIQRNAAFISKNTYISIPHTAIEKLTTHGPKLLNNLREHFIKDNPRYHRFNEILTPERLDHTFTYTPETLLFTKPEIYQNGFKRTQPKQNFHPLTISNRYYNRLRWFQKGVLTWDPTWRIKKTTAKKDLAFLTSWFIKTRLVILYATCLVLTFLKRLSTRRPILKFTSVETVVYLKQPWLNKLSWIVVFPRGPPLNSLFSSKILIFFKVKLPNILIWKGGLYLTAGFSPLYYFYARKLPPLSPPSKLEFSAATIRFKFPPSHFFFDRNFNLV